jgi:hypothetical protein
MTLINFAILGAGIPVFLVWRTVRLRAA